VTFILALVLAPLILLTFCFAVEVFAGLKPLRQQDTPPSAIGTRSAIIVPAHDEEAILADGLTSLRNAAGPTAHILVVADNCTDSTAKIGRQTGVEVVERFDAERRGKGFALDFAKRHLEADPPHVVIIVDADCSTDRPSLDRLIASCAQTGRPCQATYLQSPNRESSARVQLSSFAFFIKNAIRQRALQRLSGRGLLVGSGMAIPWPVFAQAELATGNIVEDLKLGQELAEAGHPPLFVEEATVWGHAETERNSLSQRRRWEGGFLQNSIRSGPRLLARSISRGDIRAAWAAVSLLIPPFALLLLLDLFALLLAAIAAFATGMPAWPLLLLASSMAIAGIGLVVAWCTGGWRFVSAGALARAPLYLLWKLPLYVGFLRHGAPKEWVRTSREES